MRGWVIATGPCGCGGSDGGGSDLGFGLGFWFGFGFGFGLARIADNEVHSIGESMGLVCVIDVGNSEKKRVRAVLAVPVYAKRNRTERSIRIVKRWRKCPDTIQPLPLATVYVGSAWATGQHVEAVCDGGEVVFIVTIIVIVFIDAGKISEKETGIQVLSCRHNVVDKIGPYVRR